MAQKSKIGESGRRVVNRGAWTAEEDIKLADYIQLNGAKKWKTVALKSGLNRCGKSCRLRWLNYLRPNIKRGNFSDDEQDLILRLHKLLGNRWSLIAGRLPGRTDNEIKNYWNSHLSKNANQKSRQTVIQASPVASLPVGVDDIKPIMNETEETIDTGETDVNFDMDELFDFSSEGNYGLDWVNKFLAVDEGSNIC